LQDEGNLSLLVPRIYFFMELETINRCSYWKQKSRFIYKKRKNNFM